MKEGNFCFDEVIQKIFFIGFECFTCMSRTHKNSIWSMVNERFYKILSFLLKNKTKQNLDLFTFTLNSKVLNTANKTLCSLCCFSGVKYMCVCLCVHVHPTLHNPVDCGPPRLFCPWNFPGKNTGVGCLFLLQGILPTQGLIPCLFASCIGREIDGFSTTTATWEASVPPIKSSKIGKTDMVLVLELVSKTGIRNHSTSSDWEKLRPEPLGFCFDKTA